jgi:hypothetical protein
LNAGPPAAAGTALIIRRAHMMILPMPLQERWCFAGPNLNGESFRQRLYV